MNYRIKDPKLAEEGKRKIDWAQVHMPVLLNLKKKLLAKSPLKGVKFAGCLHVTKETGVLIRTLRDLGADLTWCGCNPLSTQDDVAAALVDEGVSIYASRASAYSTRSWPRVSFHTRSFSRNALSCFMFCSPFR